jgi:DNA-binding beta-propeller fold protein YncE
MDSIRLHIARVAFGAVWAFLSASQLGAQPAETEPLRLETKIPLGDVRGRIDHMAVDPVRNRLFVAELGNNSVGVVDLASGKLVHRISELTEPQGIGYELSTDTLFVANAGDGSVRMFRGSDFGEIGRIELGDDADNVRIDAARQHLLVGYGEGAIAVIDFSQRRKIAEIALPAHPESFRLDQATGRIYVNVPKASAVIVLDSLGKAPPVTWSMRGIGGNFPMALDEDSGRVFIGFRAPARLGVFWAEGGRNVASVDLCGDTDDVFVDAKRHRAYVSCGQGYIDVFDTGDPGYRRVARIPTAPGARTAYFMPASDRYFLAVRATFTEPAAIWVFRAQP